MLTLNPEHRAKMEAMQSMVVPREKVLSMVDPARLNRLRDIHNCAARAKATPLPGEAAGVFFDGDISVNGLAVRRLVPSHLIVLQAVDSPLLKMAEQARDGGKVELNWAPQSEWDVCWIFTQDPKSVWATFKAGGKAAIQEKAETEVGLSWELANIEFVVIAVLEQYKRHIETRVRIAGEMEKDGKISFLEMTPLNPGTKTE